MQTMRAALGYQNVQAPADDDMDIVVGAEARTGNLDITARGRKVTVRDGDLNGKRLILGGYGPRVDVRNLRCDVSEGPPRDIFGIGGTFDRVVARDFRFAGVKGAQAKTHGDAVQLYNEGSVGLLHLKNGTIETAYQAIMLKRLADGRGCKRLILENVNIRDNAKDRVQQSVAILLRGCAEYVSTIELRNCWIEWPGGENYHFANSGQVTVKGAFNIGIPPGGDFCPA